jgi:hypothetical protein
MRMRSVVGGGLCLAITAGWMAAVAAQNALASLGVQETSARQDVVHALVQGRVNIYPARQAFKAAAPAARAALVKTAITWARAYTESAGFKEQWAKERAAAAPVAPKPKDVNTELARMKAEQRKGIEDAKKNLDKMPAELRAQLGATVKQMEAESAKRDADPQFAAMMRQSIEGQNAADQQHHQEAVAKHAQRYPADPNALIAQRLRQFLQASQDVDFGAALVAGPGGRQRFANAAYESKPAEWKLCFRAGKDAVAAARDAAQAWLGALGGR